MSSQKQNRLATTHGPVHPFVRDIRDEGRQAGSIVTYPAFLVLRLSPPVDGTAIVQLAA